MSDQSDERPISEGEAVRPPRRRARLNDAVPIRFTAEMVERIAPVAAAEGMTVSTWIRTEAERALASRAPSASEPPIPPTTPENER